ncbi:MAG: YbjQ family protein [Gemmatimonadales bacterium]
MSRRGTQPINHEMTSTTFDVPGYDIVETLGVVRGIVVRSRSVIGKIGAGIQMFFGGNITLYTTLCEQARENAFDIMLAHAQGVGANAVIGIRYDATEIMAGVTEVLCYGTAVVLEETPHG